MVCQDGISGTIVEIEGVDPGAIIRIILVSCRGASGKHPLRPIRMSFAHGKTSAPLHLALRMRFRNTLKSYFLPFRHWNRHLGTWKWVQWGAYVVCDLQGKHGLRVVFRLHELESHRGIRHGTRHCVLGSIKGGTRHTISIFEKAILERWTGNISARSKAIVRRRVGCARFCAPLRSIKRALTRSLGFRTLPSRC
ncbi:hypothetical protein FA13DRAFT_1725319 [Coprinellus micaceus]|uniref:Uncharacterized protein n=1 Tax=Coprinellus micaceus TaxID=71717 RepID=A0A4Y7U0L3_COPMI|nr:hypothetical protein FA13DRAFT_1725319 [Coprinellus micaceus]